MGRALLARRARMLADGGYQVAGPATPYRKPPNGELSAVRQACNTSHNRIRAAVERAIAHIKNCQVLKTGYHRHMANFPDV